MHALESLNSEGRDHVVDVLTSPGLRTRNGSSRKYGPMPRVAPAKFTPSTCTHGTGMWNTLALLGVLACSAVYVAMPLLGAQHRQALQPGDFSRRCQDGTTRPKRLVAGIIQERAATWMLSVAVYCPPHTLTRTATHPPSPLELRIGGWLFPGEIGAVDLSLRSQVLQYSEERSFPRTPAGCKDCC